MRCANKMLEIFSFFESFFRHFKRERKSVTLNYIFCKFFHTFDPHFPGKFGYGILFLGRSIKGRVVEGKISAVVYILFDDLKTFGLLVISEGAHEDKMVLGVLSEKLLNSIIDVC